MLIDIKYFNEALVEMGYEYVPEESIIVEIFKHSNGNKINLYVRNNIVVGIYSRIRSEESNLISLVKVISRGDKIDSILNI